MKITICRYENKVERLHSYSPEDFYELLKTDKFGDKLKSYRMFYPIIRNDRENDNQIALATDFMEHIPIVHFLSEYVTKEKKKTLVAHNGLVLLEVNNVIDTATAIAIRNKASLQPYTYLTFVGASRRSVKIVCRAETLDGGIPERDSDFEKFVRKAYQKLFYLYSTQLDVTVDKRMPTADMTCRISSDADVFFNPNAEPLRVDISERDIPEFIRSKTGAEVIDSILPGMEDIRAQRHLFYFCLNEMLYNLRLNVDEDDYVCHALTMLAKYCHQSGLLVEMCVRLTCFNHAIGRDHDLVRKIFNCEYASDLHKIMPHKHIKPSTLLAYKTEYFMQTHYEMRKNVMTGVAQYRHRDGFDYEFHDITDEDRNTMTILAQKEGLDSWDKDMDRYIHSRLIPQYDPVNDYLDHLPEWDGKDRITAFADRVKSDDPHWQHNFHVWWLSMVAHWMNLDQQHGNAIAPLLIGKQGCGKSSFCGIILPEKLRDYYHDKIDMCNPTAISLSMTSFALINIDEFDSVSKNKQPILKQLLSSAEVKMRPPYGKTFVNYRRYASFIGTTNDMRPLVDYTGGRRFICIMVDGNIDFESPVDYEQIYAQLKCEISRGERYWFDDTETQAIINRNVRFRKITDISQMISTLFAKSKDEDAAAFMSINEVVTILQTEFTNFTTSKNANMEIGRCMTKMGFKSKHMNSGTMYLVQRIT